jgi:hypothetical protein
MLVRVCIHLARIIFITFYTHYLLYLLHVLCLTFNNTFYATDLQTLINQCSCYDSSRVRDRRYVTLPYELNFGVSFSFQNDLSI